MLSSNHHQDQYANTYSTSEATADARPRGGGIGDNPTLNIISRIGIAPVSVSCTIILPPQVIVILNEARRPEPCEGSPKKEAGDPSLFSG